MIVFRRLSDTASEVFTGFQIEGWTQYRWLPAQLIEVADIETANDKE